MALHRNQELFVRARWRRGILFPAWAAQIVLLLTVFGVFSYRLADTAKHFADDRAAGKTPTVELVWECTNVGLGLLCLVLTVLEATRLLSETLTPFFLLATHVIKMTCAAAMLALDVVVYIHRSEGNWSSVGLGIDAALLAAMLALFVYAILAFRRGQLDYDDYHHNNVKAFGFGSGHDEIELSDSNNSRGMRDSTSGLVNNGAGMGSGGIASGDVFLRAGPYNDVPTEYDPSRSGIPPPPAAAAADRSVNMPLSGSPADGNGRRTSYSHERDTQFDSYLMFHQNNKNASPALGKNDIDKALSTELWGTATAPPLGNSSGGGGSVERSNSVVATGVVASHYGVTARVPHPDVMNRTVSWNVEHGLVTVPGSIRTVGSVATIAEEHEGGGGHSYGERAVDHDHDDDNDVLAHGQYRTKGANEDRALLMGHSRHASEDHDEQYHDERGPIPETGGHGYGHA